MIHQKRHHGHENNVWSGYGTIRSTMTRIASTLLIPYWNCFNLFHSLTKNEERHTVGNEPLNKLQFQPGNESLNDLQFQPCTPVPSSVPTSTNTPFLLKTASSSLFRLPERSTDANHSRNKVTSSSKRTELMDPATFKLVSEHQKEYSVQDKTIRSHDPITIARKKQSNTFWTSTTKIARKKKKR